MNEAYIMVIPNIQLGNLAVRSSKWLGRVPASPLCQRTLLSCRVNTLTNECNF